MGWKPSGNSNGYGSADRKMAKQLRGAGSRDEADRIARSNGLKNADDAKDWLSERDNPDR